MSGCLEHGSHVAIDALQYKWELLMRRWSRHSGYIGEPQLIRDF